MWGRLGNVRGVEGRGRNYEAATSFWYGTRGLFRGFSGGSSVVLGTQIKPYLVQRFQIEIKITMFVKTYPVFLRCLFNNLTLNCGLL